MKKGILTLLAALTIFSLAITGCPTPNSSGGDPTYTVTYDKNGGGGTVPEAVKDIKKNTEITLAEKGDMTAPATKPNFLGWNESKTATTGTTGKYTVTKDVKFYAIWSAQAAVSCTVTYDLNGGTGTAPTQDPVNSGTSITLKPGTGMTPPAGKAFGGWSETATGAALTGTTYTVNADVTLYAVWDTVYTVTFKPGTGAGGKPAPEGPLTQTAKGAGIQLPAVGTMTGPTGKTFFGGWAETEGAVTTAAVTSPYVPTKNTDLYAVWSAEAVKFKVSFDSNGGTGTQAEITQATAGAAVQLPATTTFTPPANKVFDGWGETATSTEKITSVTPTSPTTVFALWKGAPATVTFNSNGGTGTVATVNTTVGATIQLPAGTGLSKEGYTFKGWSDTAAGANPRLPGADFLVNKTAETLFAAWEAGGGGGGDEEEEIDLTKEIYQGAELVTLMKANQAVYYFELPAGGKYSDYSGLKASYLVPQAATFELSNSGRAQRVYGNYGLDFFQYLTTDAGNKIAYAQLGEDDNGSSAVNNNQYILDDTGSGGWKTLSAALIAELGECPDVDQWFTITYKIDGTRANVKPHKHLPYDIFEGPVILGLGLPGEGDANKIFMKDIKLVGKGGKADVVGKALYIKKDGVDYPAFSAYGNKDGQAGEDVVARQIIGSGGVQKVVINAPDADTLAKIALVKGSYKVSLTNAHQVVYKFELPTGKTWGDYKGLDASYLVPDANLFDLAGSCRTMRLYGVYDIDYFSINETTAGNKYAYASLDGNANNNQYILDDLSQSNKKLSEALIAVLGECPEEYEWFTINYKIDGNRANVKPHKHLPAATDTGPFYIGLGIPGATGVITTLHMKDITLVGTSAADNVVGTPLYLTKDGYDYPTFSAYGTASGNGVDDTYIAKWDGSRGYGDKVVAYVAPREIVVSFDVSNDPNATAVATTITLKKNDSFLIRTGVLPTATTTTAYTSLKGWSVTSGGTTAVTVGDGASNAGMAFSTSTNATETLYAIWGVTLPDATEDLDITTTITGKIGGFGGLPEGEQGMTGGLGPYTFNAAAQYSSAIDFNFADVTELTTNTYKEVKVEFELSDMADAAGATAGLPMKLAFHAGRKHDLWSGGTSTYGDFTEEGAQTKTFTLNADTIANGIVIQHNGNNQAAASIESSSFKLTITKVTLIKP